MPKKNFKKKKVSKEKLLLEDMKTAFGVFKIHTNPLKDVPFDIVYRLFREVMVERPRNKAALFYWKIKEWKKTIKK